MAYQKKPRSEWKQWTKRDPLERFNEKWIPEPMSGCWLWLGSYASNGYASFFANGKRKNASRWSWILHNGPISNTKTLVCHKCDNPGCVNPDHLFLGDHADNCADMWAKGRQSKDLPPKALKGSSNPTALLSEEKVVAIREAASSGTKYADLAVVYGVCKATIQHAVNGLSWAHVTGRPARRRWTAKRLKTEPAIAKIAA